MAGGQERILRGRIRSVQATKKITRAMELIAGSRIVKAQQRVQAAVPYSEQITNVVRDLAAAGAAQDSPLLAGRDEINTTCYVAIAADRGLCGGYNAGVQRAAEGEVKADVQAGKQYEIVPAGSKVEGYFRFRGYELGEQFSGFSGAPSYADAQRIGKHVVERFVSGEVDKVEVLVGGAVGDFGAWVRSRTGAQAISSVRAHAEAIQQSEVERALRRLSHLPERDRNVVRSLATGIVNKMVHDPVLALRTAESDAEIDQILDILGVDHQ